MKITFKTGGRASFMLNKSAMCQEKENNTKSSKIRKAKTQTHSKEIR